MTKIPSYSADFAGLSIGSAQARWTYRSALVPPMARLIVREALLDLSDQYPTTRLISAPHGGAIPENEVSWAARKIVNATDMALWTPRDLRPTATSRLTDLGGGW